MAEPKNKRVALFQSNWIVSSQTANAVTVLADAGYAVELFLFNSPQSQDYVSLQELRDRTKAQIHQLWTGDQAPPQPAISTSANGAPSLKRRLTSSLKECFPPLAYTVSSIKKACRIYTLKRGLGEGILTAGQVEKALQVLAGKHYHCLIGMEKKGLIWAGIVARRLRVPFFYHSLELYTDEGEYWRIFTENRFEFQCLRLGERLHHRNAAATIIQDPERAAVLLRANGVDRSRAQVLYVPVAVLGPPYQQRSRYLHESLGIPSDRKIILYFGHVWERRYVLELTQAAQHFPEDWLLVMHGPAADCTAQSIRQLDQRHRVMLSQKMVPADRVQEVIASADVGLLFYSSESQNERLTAFASEKMALYMQCGVPFLAFDYPGFRRLAEEERCGMVVRDFDQLPEAIRSVLKRWEEYSAAAHQVFAKYYSFADSYAKVVEAIDQL
jgi:glycosyltransferase involved in cell wall biosynthesis